MIGTLLYTTALCAPEIAEAVADGAAALAVAAGTNLGRGLVKGVADGLCDPETQDALAEGAAGALMAAARTLTR